MPITKLLSQIKKKSPHEEEAKVLGDAEGEMSAEELLQELKELNTQLRDFVGWFTDLRRRLLAGLATGLGTVLGATILVSLLLYALRPLMQIEMLRPFVEEVVQMVEQDEGTPGAPNGGATTETGGGDQQGASNEEQLAPDNGGGNQASPSPQPEPDEPAEETTEGTEANETTETEEGGEETVGGATEDVGEPGDEAETPPESP
jgi:hypothetical protein